MFILDTINKNITKDYIDDISNNIYNINNLKIYKKGDKYDKLIKYFIKKYHKKIFKIKIKIYGDDNFNYLSKCENLLSLIIYGHHLNSYNDGTIFLPSDNLKKLNTINIYDYNEIDLYNIMNYDKLINIKFYRIKKINNLIYISNIINLKYLTLRYCSISNIDFIKNLINLEKLDLYCNMIYDISPLKKLNKLTRLNLTNNNINDIQSLKHLDKLTSLRLSFNKINDISIIINYCPNIKFLSLKYTKLITNNIIELHKLKNLIYLNICDNKDIIFNDIFIKTILNCQRLKVLSIVNLRCDINIDNINYIEFNKHFDKRSRDGDFIEYIKKDDYKYINS